MGRILKYLMKIFYANNKYAKYRTEGWGYYIAILGTTFYIYITSFLLLIIFTCLFKEFYISFQNGASNINSKLFSISYVAIGCLILGFTIKEDQIKDSHLTKAQVNKAVNYLIAYALLVGISICFLVLKFLRPLAH